MGPEIQQENGAFGLISDEIGPTECRSCAIGRSAGGRSSTVVRIDSEAVVVRQPTRNGLLVVPRQHIGRLDELPVPRRASVLATLRRATRSVCEGNPGSSSRVVASMDEPGSRGHVVFPVLPSGSPEPLHFVP